MTSNRLLIAGALVLNIPTVFAAAVLPAGAVVISALVLAAIGASLGAVTGWALAGPSAATETAAESSPAYAERLAA